MTSPRPDRARPWRRAVGRAVVVVALATLALILVLLVIPARAGQAMRWYLLGVAAIAAATAIGGITARYPVLWRSSFEQALRAPEPPEELPARLLGIERLVSRASWDAGGYQTELRPILCAIAAQRLATYRTIDMDRQPEAARAVLGDRVWALLAPVDLETIRSAGGIDLRDLQAAVETLENLNVNPHA
jgi:hypothetical protein